MNANELIANNIRKTIIDQKKEAFLREFKIRTELPHFFLAVIPRDSVVVDVSLERMQKRYAPLIPTLEGAGVKNPDVRDLEIQEDGSFLCVDSTIDGPAGVTLQSCVAALDASFKIARQLYEGLDLGCQVDVYCELSGLKRSLSSYAWPVIACDDIQPSSLNRFYARLTRLASLAVIGRLA
jgi:hypothetical protein